MSIDTPVHAPSRRRILQGVAWATPAVLVASAVPSRAASEFVGGEDGDSWIFRDDRSSYNAGYYDLKSQMWRTGPSPARHPRPNDLNAPHDGTALIVIFLTVDLSAMDGDVPFFSVDPSDPLGGTAPLRLNSQTIQDGWEFGSASVSDEGVLTIPLVNSTTYTGFNPGRAIQNVHVVVPTTNPGQNGWQKDGSQHIQVTFTASTFVTRGPEPLSS